ncbi:MAG: hypothetical protein ACKVU1_02805 [bacterium]
MRIHVVLLSTLLLAWNVGCSDDHADLVGPDASDDGAVIVGQIVSADGSSKLLQDCTDAIVTLNGVPASIEFDDDCEFVVTGVVPAELLALRIELPALGVSSTIEISDVTAGELIEIEVEATEDQLSMVVVRRAAVSPADLLPIVVTGNNVQILIARGLYSQDLTVQGNKFVLVGQAGDNCLSSGWTEIEGDVFVTGNKATFRNIAFTGDVTVSGNKARFINCCFNGELVRFGHGHHADDDEDDDDNDEGDDD